jgi:hypothetical protein
LENLGFCSCLPGEVSSEKVIKIKIPKKKIEGNHDGVISFKIIKLLKHLVIVKNASFGSLSY